MRMWNMKLSEVEKRYLVNLIESGEQIPEDYKYLINCKI